MAFCTLGSLICGRGFSLSSLALRRWDYRNQLSVHLRKMPGLETTSNDLSGMITQHSQTADSRSIYCPIRIKLLTDIGFTSSNVLITQISDKELLGIVQFVANTAISFNRLLASGNIYFHLCRGCLITNHSVIDAIDSTLFMSLRLDDSLTKHFGISAVDADSVFRRHFLVCTISAKDFHKTLATLNQLVSNYRNYSLRITAKENQM